MTIVLLDPSAEDRTRIREVLAAVEAMFVEIDPTRPFPDEVFASARLVLLETDLTGDIGFGVLDRIRRLRPELPIVVVTRRVEEDRIIAAMKAGASDHVGKDRLDRLPLVIREALARGDSRGDAERTLAHLHSKLRSTGDIAHELSNVLQPIRLAADLLRRIQDEPRRGKLLDSVVVCIERSRELLGRLRESARGEETSLVTPDEPALPVGRQQVILVVDDEDDVRAMVQLAVEDHGYRTVAARNGAEGLMVFHQHQQEIVAVIVDFMMPVLDGPAMIRALRPIAPTMPILLVSGLAAGTTLDELSLRYFLPKPFTTSQLLDALDRLLSEEPRP